jgi:hypothetical protein
VFQVNGRADIPVGVDQIFTFIGSKRGGDPGSEALRAAAFPESNMVLSRDSKAKLLATQVDSSQGKKVIASTEAQSKSRSSNSANRTTDLPPIRVSPVQNRAESKHSKSKTAASKHSKDVSDLPAVVNQGDKVISNNATAAKGIKDGSSDAAAKEAAPPVPATPAVNPNAAIDDLLNELKEKHKLALANLQSIVDGDSLKRVKPLEDRLVMRKLQLADRKKAADSVNSGVDAETEQRFITALKDEIGEIQTEIDEAQVKAQRTKEGFGFVFQLIGTFLRNIDLGIRPDRRLQEEVHL